MIYSTNLLKINLSEPKYFFYWDKMRNEIETQIYGKNKDERSQNIKEIEKLLEQKIENLTQNKYLVLDFDEYLEQNKMENEVQNQLEKSQNSHQNIQDLVNFISQIHKKLKTLKIFVISDYSQNEFEIKIQIEQNSNSQNQIQNQSYQNLSNSQNSIFLDKLNYTFLSTNPNVSHILPNSNETTQNLANLENQIQNELGNKATTKTSKEKILQNIRIDNKISINQISFLNISLDKINNLETLAKTKLEIAKILDLDLNLLILWKNNSGELRKQLILTLDLYLTFLTRDNILTQNKRVDNRPLDLTREIKCQIGVLPHNHGSSLFARGETQVLNVLTLGTTRDGQTLDDMENFDEEETKNYIHHYNFPSYSVGETGRYFGPGRREIGHGALAEKALLPVLPNLEKFPYTMRLVSECLGSNGSTSMASTCASTLSLLQGGVPISDSVAGVAMGLVLANR